MGLMTKVQLETSALALNPQDRQELVDVLWASLEPAPAPLPAWQLELLDERLADLEAHPESGASWEEVRARVWPESR
jgi:putative addiction module component (TIGR02574 family)